MAIIKPSDILQKGLELISKPENFCRGHYAIESITGKEVIPESNVSGQFCSIGAIRRACFIFGVDSSSLLRMDSQDYLYKYTNNSDITTFNDTQSYEDVINVWKQAIEKAKQDEIQRDCRFGN